MPTSQKTTISYGEATVVVLICFGLFILFSFQAVFAGFPDAHFSDSGNAWMIGLEVVLAATALLYLRARGFDIGSLYPNPSLGGTLLGLGIFAASWFVGALVTSSLYSSVQPQLIEFSYSGPSLTGLIPLAMVNGAFEEVFLLGVLVRGLRSYGLSVAIGLPLLVRVLYHLYQGPTGAVWILAFGLTFTLFYIRGQKLWPPVLAHILWDIVPFATMGT